MSDDGKNSGPKQLIRFYIKACKSIVNDRIVYKDEIYVEVTISKNDIPNLKATPEHFQRWPAQWRAFQETDEYKAYRAFQESGVEAYTPLAVLGATPSSVSALQDVGIKSVEELLSANEDHISHIRGIEYIKNLARNHKPEQAPVREEVVPVLAEVVEAPEFVEPPKNKGGRPPKQAAA